MISGYPLDHGVFGYTVPPDDLVERAVQRLEDFYGWHTALIDYRIDNRDYVRQAILGMRGA